MNQSLEFSTLLNQVVDNTGRKCGGIHVGSLSGLVAHARISPAKGSVERSVNGKDLFYIGLLEELFSELTFYYYQSKTDKTAEIRLEKALKGLANTMNELGPGNIENFLKSVVNEPECTWFMISTFTGFPKVNPVFFKNKLFNTIKHSNQLNKEFKAALVRSKAGTLKNDLQDVFAFSTLATKLAILDILGDRQEIDEQWLHSLQKSAEPILNAKIAILLNLDK